MLEARHHQRTAALLSMPTRAHFHTDLQVSAVSWHRVHKGRAEPRALVHGHLHLAHLRRAHASQSVRRLSEGRGRTSTSKLVCCAITRAVFAVSTPPVDSSNGANILKSQMPDALAIEATMERCFENVVGPTAKKGVERSQPFHYRGCRDSYFDRSLRNPHTPPKTPCGWGHKSFTR